MSEQNQPSNSLPLEHKQPLALQTPQTRPALSTRRRSEKRPNKVEQSASESRRQDKVKRKKKVKKGSRSHVVMLKDNNSRKTTSKSMIPEASGAVEAQKSKQTQERRIRFRYSCQPHLEPLFSDFTFFQGEIEDFYPSYVTHDLLARLDVLQESAASTAADQVSQPTQPTPKLTYEELFGALPCTAKQSSELYSVVLKRPHQSAMLFYSGDYENISGHGSCSTVEEDRPETDLLSLCRVQYISYNDACEMQQRTRFKSQLLKSLKKYSQNHPEKPNAVSQINQELLFLTNYLQVQHKQNHTSLDSLRRAMMAQMDRGYPNPNLDELDNRYMESVIRKNVLRGLQDHQLDVLSYFKLQASLEENRQYEPNLNLTDLKDFINKKKVKRNKKTKFPLATSCMGCLSSTNEFVNQMVSCYQCGSRAHSICKVISDNPCTICETRRTKKIRIKQCLLCPNRSFLFKRLGSFNVHVFCLLIFNLYSVIDCQVIVDSDSIRTKQSNPNPCLCCGLSTGKLVKCHQTASYVHPLCAYLAGFFMTVDKRQVVINTKYYDEEELERNKFARYYRGNLHKFAYRFYSYDDYREKSRNKRNKGDDDEASMEADREEEDARDMLVGSMMMV